MNSRQNMDDMHDSQPVKWYRLIRDMEEFRARTGMGLGLSWMHVHNEQYDMALESFNQVKDSWPWKKE